MLIYDYLTALLGKWKSLVFTFLDVIGYLIFIVFDIGQDGKNFPSILYVDWIYVAIGLITFAYANYRVYVDIKIENVRLKNDLDAISKHKSNLHLFFDQEGRPVERVIISVNEAYLSDFSDKIRNKKNELLQSRDQLSNKGEETLGVAKLLDINPLKGEQEYVKEVDKYIEEYTNYLLFHDFKALEKARRREVVFCLTNEGGRSAENVTVEVIFPSELSLVGDEYDEGMSALEDYSSLPDQPSPYVLGSNRVRYPYGIRLPDMSIYTPLSAKELMVIPCLLILYM